MTMIAGVLIIVSQIFTSTILAYDVCELPYHKIGCFNDLPNPRTFPNLLLNARYPGAKSSPGYSVTWDIKKYQEFLPRFICDCAKAAFSFGTKYFGIQYYAECWSGVLRPENFVKLGLTTSCVNSTFGPCGDDSQQCSGKEFTNMIYYIPGKIETTTRNAAIVTTTKPRKTTAKPPKTTTKPPKTTTKSPKTTTQPPKATTQTSKTTTKAPTTRAKPPTTTAKSQTTTAKPTTGTTKTPTSTVITTEDVKKPGCMKKADILIALDISSSISLDEFEKRKQFMSDFVARFPVNENDVHFALLYYNHNIHTDFTFEDPHFYNMSAVQKTILQVPLLGGATLTQKTLDEALQVFSMPQYGARSTSKKILIIVTDGYTYGGEETLELPSLKLQLFGVNIVAVGFGRRTNMIGLRMMSTNVVTMDNMFQKTREELSQDLDTFVQVVCKSPLQTM